MAFPDTSILDDFNRSDGGLGSDWAQFGYVSDTLVIVNQMARAASSGTNCGVYWTPANFGPDCECYMTIYDSRDYHVVHARFTDPDTGTPDGYYVQARTPDSQVRVYRVDNGSPTQLGSSISQAVADGDKLGIKCSDDSIDAWYDDGGAGWGEVGSRTDSTYDTSGAIGIGTYSGNPSQTEYDDFGGCTLGAEEEPIRLLALLGVGE